MNAIPLTRKRIRSMFLMIMWYRLRRMLAVLALGSAILHAYEGRAPRLEPVAPVIDTEQHLIGEDAADLPPPAPPEPDRTIFRRVVARLFPAPPQLSSLKLK